MIKKFLMIAMACLVLSAASCQPEKQLLNRDVFVAVVPPEALYNCPQVKKVQFPDPEKATNKEVSEFIALLYSYNRQCGISMKEIRKWVKDAKKLIEEQNKA